MKTRLVLCLISAALLLAAAKTYSVDLYQSTMVGSTELKAGAYEVKVVDQKAILTRGKTRVESPVTVATADKKYTKTSVFLNQSNGKAKIQEIHLGGTTTKLVFAE